MSPEQFVKGVNDSSVRANTVARFLKIFKKKIKTGTEKYEIKMKGGSTYTATRDTIIPTMKYLDLKDRSYAKLDKNTMRWLAWRKIGLYDNAKFLEMLTTERGIYPVLNYIEQNVGNVFLDGLKEACAGIQNSAYLQHVLAKIAQVYSPISLMNHPDVIDLFIDTKQADSHGYASNHIRSMFLGYERAIENAGDTYDAKRDRHVACGNLVALHSLCNRFGPKKLELTYPWSLNALQHVYTDDISMMHDIYSILPTSGWEKRLSGHSFTTIDLRGMAMEVIMANKYFSSEEKAKMRLAFS